MESKENAIVPTLEDDSIKSRIFTIRGVQVMLDRDLAELYGVPTKRLNEQVKRNSIRFPANFMFPLSDTEIPDVFIHGTDMPNRSRSQIATLNHYACKRVEKRDCRSCQYKDYQRLRGDAQSAFLHCAVTCPYRGDRPAADSRPDKK